MLSSPVLKSLLIRDFRSISGEWVVPLDAGIVLIHGPNGAGKTSLLSALELAATGRISYLDRLGDADYRKHLHHRDTNAGLVTVETEGLLERNRGSASVGGRGLESRPLLSGELAETFMERCFLPQATLGRLFEIYAPRSDDVQTPLIRFVKEVLGLDALDALVDGLYSSADVRRAHKLSETWQAAIARTKNLERRLLDASSALSSVQDRAGDLMTGVRAHVDALTGHAPEDDDILLAMASGIMMSNAGNSSDSARLQQALLSLVAVEGALAQAELLTVDPDEPEGDSGLGAAEARYLEWKETRSLPLMQWYRDRYPENEGGAEPEPAALLRLLRAEIDVVDSTRLQAMSQLASLRDLERRSTTTRTRLSELDRDLAKLAGLRSVAATSSSAAELASTLVSIVEHVEHEVCPVCDQEFKLGGALRGHILAKIEALNENVEQLLLMETRRAALEAERNAIGREMTDQNAIRAHLGDASELDSQVLGHARRLSELRSLEPLGEAGELLAEKVAELRSHEGESSYNRSILERSLIDLNGVASVLGLESPAGLMVQRIALLRAAAQSELDGHLSGDRQVAELQRLQDEYLGAVEQVGAKSRVVAEIKKEIATLARQMREARRRKESASSLRKEAEALRTAITTQVFDQHLNRSWARIFGALVPSEPYVPQFKGVPVGARRVTVDVETVDPNGVRAAAPAAMLSQGNLNTAALSLFIALHFAVPARLPWLIFDDPVQSMDELHISNLAAMIKQLTRRYGRQVVIAVHERELFDYLALELTPASPKDELIKVSLNRTYGNSIVTHERQKFEEDHALSPSSAA